MRSRSIRLRLKFVDLRNINSELSELYLYQYFHRLPEDELFILRKYPALFSQCKHQSVSNLGVKYEKGSSFSSGCSSSKVNILSFKTRVIGVVFPRTEIDVPSRRHRSHTHVFACIPLTGFRWNNKDRRTEVVWSDTGRRGPPDELFSVIKKRGVRNDKSFSAGNHWTRRVRILFESIHTSTHIYFDGGTRVKTKIMDAS